MKKNLLKNSVVQTLVASLIGEPVGRDDVAAAVAAATK